MGKPQTQDYRSLPAFGQYTPHQKTGFDKFCAIASTVFLIVAPIFLAISLVTLVCVIHAVKQEMKENHEAEVRTWFDPAYFDDSRGYKGTSHSELTPYHKPQHH